MILRKLLIGYYMNEADIASDLPAGEVDLDNGDDVDTEELSFEEWEAQQKESKDAIENSSSDKFDSEHNSNSDEISKNDVEDQGKDKRQEKAQDSQVIKTYRIKVDGKDEEIEITEDKIPTVLSKAIAADRRFQEAAQIRHEAKEFVDYLKSNPIDALSKLGVDFGDLAEKHLYEKIQYEQMNEEQQEAFDNKKELERIKAENEKRQQQDEQQRKEYEEQQRKQQEQELINIQRQEIQNQMIQAMEQSGLPNNKFTVTRMAQYMKAALAGGKNISPMDVVEQVQADYDEIREQSRRADVATYKQRESKQNQPKITKHKANPNKKRLTSIYDLME